ncbi:MAG: 50S ribosomal protein L2 [Candidatus Wildermuthbacteria bacterium]|nr:50S ribosomal protein L2 [Candidatus Wildermuthbacteria bacterium]
MPTNLSKEKPKKKFLQWMKKTGGRARSGRITAWQRGGGYRKLYRKIDFGQEHKGIAGTVERIEYDPNRTSSIALIRYQDGSEGYIVLPDGLHVGDTIICNDAAELGPGNRMQLKNIPVGTMVYNIELEPDRGGKIVRGAGTAAKVLAHEGKYAQIQLPSSEIRKILDLCFASVGIVSNPEHRYHRIPNAGRMRKMGWRPNVRGKAMNPVDHPHGGGEGRTSTGLKYPKTPWGKPALGVKTRRRIWTNTFILQRRKKKK